jgi:hypothetical protein
MCLHHLYFFCTFFTCFVDWFIRVICVLGKSILCHLYCKYLPSLSVQFLVTKMLKFDVVKFIRFFSFWLLVFMLQFEVFFLRWSNYSFYFILGLLQSYFFISNILNSPQNLFHIHTCESFHFLWDCLVILSHWCLGLRRTSTELLLLPIGAAPGTVPAWWMCSEFFFN